MNPNSQYSPKLDNQRRNFLQKSLASATDFARSQISSDTYASLESKEDDFKPEVVYKIDVLVVDSGSAGTPAAIQAGHSRLVRRDTKPLHHPFHWIRFMDCFVNTMRLYRQNPEVF